ncbi:uncharacterized protein LOC110861652 [Folsomia candida]|uniref:uncharacterized protein LOC110861652 n=1 Tax=Folsomia candida TaxID=158441 RepID=UPI000B904022|nr:uncharacterized protein LOC110861652 [Folsomia candida]
MASQRTAKLLVLLCLICRGGVVNAGGCASTPSVLAKSAAAGGVAGFSTAALGAKVMAVGASTAGKGLAMKAVMWMGGSAMASGVGASIAAAAGPVGAVVGLGYFAWSYYACENLQNSVGPGVNNHVQCGPCTNNCHCK